MRGGTGSSREGEIGGTRKACLPSDPGNRVFVYLPARGYVGVGTVIEGALPVTEFTVTNEAGEMIPCWRRSYTHLTSE